MLKSGIYDFVICRGGTDMCFVLGLGRKRPGLKQYRISGLTSREESSSTTTYATPRARLLRHSRRSPRAIRALRAPPRPLPTPYALTVRAEPSPPLRAPDHELERHGHHGRTP